MLDYGFKMYNIDKVIDKGDSLGIIKVNLGSPEYVDIVSKKDITILNNSQKEKRKIDYDIETNELTAPVKIGDTVGRIKVYENNKYSYDVELTVAHDINKANIFKIFIRNIRDIFGVNV